MHMQQIIIVSTQFRQCLFHYKSGYTLNNGYPFAFMVPIGYRHFTLNPRTNQFTRYGVHICGHSGNFRQVWDNMQHSHRLASSKMRAAAFSTVQYE